MSTSPTVLQYIEVHGTDTEHFACITDTLGAYLHSIDTPVYDSTDPDNQPETLAQYAQRISSEYPGFTLYMGDAPQADIHPIDPDKPVAKYREQVGAVLGHFLLYPGDVTERVSKQRYEQTRVPVQERT